jgi:hypothetical protein
MKQPGNSYEMTSPKVGHEYWQNGEYSFPEDSKPVRFINVKADDDFIYSMVFLNADKELIFELQSQTTGGKWKTFEIGADEHFCGFTGTYSELNLTGLSFHKWT